VILLDLIHNIALVAMLSVVFRLLGRRVGLETPAGRVFSGFLFGAVVLLGMMTPVTIMPGLIFDGRSVVLCAAGVIGGPIVAGIAAIAGAAYRVYLGGGGAVMGVLVIIESAALGTLFFYMRRRNPRLVRARNLFLLGATVHVLMVALMFTLPGTMTQAALGQVALVTLTVYPLATVAVCRTLLDDEERLLIREALDVSEERLARAVEASNTGLFDWNLTTDAYDVNDAWAAMLGMTPEELAPITGESWRSLIHPDDVARADLRLARHLAGETSIYSSEYRMRHSDGHWVWVSARGTVVERDAAGKPLRISGSHLDISVPKETETALRESHDQMEDMVRDVAEAMGRIVEVRDPYTQGHQSRVAQLARRIATRMGMPEDEIDGVEMAALLHDVGKTRVPIEILSKPGRLSELEFSLIKEHSLLGHEILKDIQFPWPIAEMVRQHHERADGSGYPAGLAGDEILVAARIIAVADVVEAMASDRPYRRALGIEEAIAEIRDNPGKYDPEVAAACFAIHDSEGIIFAT
jgi:PAS domain S-box-containing protein/putative nucleotidyltransferase with HDIG domain